MTLFVFSNVCAMEEISCRKKLEGLGKKLQYITGTSYKDYKIHQTDYEITQDELKLIEGCINWVDTYGIIGMKVAREWDRFVSPNLVQVLDILTKHPQHLASEPDKLAILKSANDFSNILTGKKLRFEEGNYLLRNLVEADYKPAMEFTAAHWVDEIFMETDNMQNPARFARSSGKQFLLNTLAIAIDKDSQPAIDIALKLPNAKNPNWIHLEPLLKILSALHNKGKLTTEQFQTFLAKLITLSDIKKFLDEQDRLKHKLDIAKEFSILPIITKAYIQMDQILITKVRKVIGMLEDHSDMQRIVAFLDLKKQKNITGQIKDQPLEVLEKLLLDIIYVVRMGESLHPQKKLDPPLDEANKKSLEKILHSIIFDWIEFINKRSQEIKAIDTYLRKTITKQEQLQKSLLLQTTEQPASTSTTASSPTPSGSHTPGSSS